MSRWENTEASKYNHAYLEGYFPENAKEYFEEEVCKVVDKVIKGPKKLLDIGCGPCFAKDIANPYNIEVIGLDIASALTPYWQHYKIPAVVATSSEMPFKDSIFDVVMAWDVMEHIPEEGIVPTLLEIMRVGKKKALVHFCICLTEEVRKFEGMQFHLTIKPWQWWINLLAKIGFRTPAQFTLDPQGSHLTASLVSYK